MVNKQPLIVYAWDTTNKRYLHASEFKVTVNLNEGLHLGGYIAFLGLPVGIHNIDLKEKPDGLILDKWTSGASAVWVEADIHYPKQYRTWVTTHSGGPAFIRIFLREVDIHELLRERKEIMDQITASLGLTYEEIDAIELIQLCRERWPDVSTIIWDGKYRFATHEQTLKVIDADWIDAKIYRKTYYDCDDFAQSFKSHLSEYWGINGVGFADGSLWKGDEFRGVHYYNYILTHGDNGVKILLFEPQDDKMTEGDTLGELTFKPNRIIW